MRVSQFVSGKHGYMWRRTCIPLNNVYYPLLNLAKSANLVCFRARVIISMCDAVTMVAVHGGFRQCK